MENLTPDHLRDALMVFLALLGAIAAVGKAADVLLSWFSPARKKNARIAECEARLARDHKRLETLEEGNRVQCRALLALLHHEITGNSIDKLKDAQAGINNYLINR